METVREWLNVADWGDVATWVAAVVSLVALWRAWTAKKEARQARLVNERMAGAQERMAEVMERRIEQVETLGHVSAEEPAIAWEIEWRGGDIYALRNLGTETATGVKVVRDLVEDFSIDLPDGVDLGPLRSHQFWFAPSLARSTPAELFVTTDQQPEPQAVPMPPTRH